MWLHVIIHNLMGVITIVHNLSFLIPHFVVDVVVKIVVISSSFKPIAKNPHSPVIVHVAGTHIIVRQ